MPDTFRIAVLRVLIDSCGEIVPMLIYEIHSADFFFFFDCAAYHRRQHPHQLHDSRSRQTSHYLMSSRRRVHIYVMRLRRMGNRRYNPLFIEGMMTYNVPEEV